tara:strand:- start:47 stop:685 length:639 start_codon:yes stop_codon:yes gene_type:complete
MLKEELIIDNLIHPNIQNFLLDKIKKESYCITDYTGDMDDEIIKRLDNTYEQFQLVSNINPYEINNNIFLLPLISTLSFLNIDFKIENLLRVKCNTQTKSYINNQNKYNVPHYDQGWIQNEIKNQLVIIYHGNTADSNTVIFKDKIFPPIDNSNNVIFDGFELKLNKATPKKIIETKQGRIIVFMGDTLHTGQHPIKSPMRHVINYNYSLDT